LLAEFKKATCLSKVERLGGRGKPKLALFYSVKMEQNPLKPFAVKDFKAHKLRCPTGPQMPFSSW
jgi:hypothetical protein